MDITYFLIVIFIIITAIYFMFPEIGKIPLTLTDITSEETINTYRYTNYLRLGLYFMMVMISQFIISAVYIVNNCGGNNTSNYAAAFIITFMPWIFIFGIVILVLIMFPGFKSAFSDVIGYFVVANSANKILNEILFDEKLEKTLSDDKITDPTVQESSRELMKLYSNKAILINQIVPDNFLSIWDKIKPLMKPGAADNSDLKTKFLNIVALRENVGEAMWYIYTGLVVISIVSYKLSSRDCQLDIYDVQRQGVQLGNRYQGVTGPATV